MIKVEFKYKAHPNSNIFRFFSDSEKALKFCGDVGSGCEILAVYDVDTKESFWTGDKKLLVE